MTTRTKFAKQNQQKLETLTLRMQFFCLDPKIENYTEISSCIKLKNEQADLFDIWNLAVLAKYGIRWNMDQSIIENAKISFKKESEKISSLLLFRPTSKLLDKIWYIFFATGELSALQAAFEVAGNQKASKELKDTALQMFEVFRDEYRKKISETLSNKPDFFTSHESGNVALISSQVFDQFDELINKKTNEINQLDNNPLEDEDDINSIISKTIGDYSNDQNLDTDSDSNIDSDFGSDFDEKDEKDDEKDEKDEKDKNENDDEKDEKKKEKERKREEKKKYKKELKKASGLFDEIAKDVMTKVKFTKH